MKFINGNNLEKKGKWERSGCVRTPQYDPTTDYPSYAHRCTACGGVSYFPVDYPDAFCRRCGKQMEVTHEQINSEQ